MPLSENTLKTVEATAGLVAAQGPELTRAFYEKMLGNNPELKDIFNLAHQRNLRQPQALFDSVVAYALNIRKINEFYVKKEQSQPIAEAELLELQGFFSVAERIAQKHTSFGILPLQYQIVGANLLATISDKITKDEAILAEWGKAYEFLANMLIKREEEIYSATEARKGGWRPTRTFRVAEKTKISELVFKFKLVPTQDKEKGVLLHKPGQYLAIFARNPTFFPFQEIRQYSIVSVPNEEYYEIAVKKHDKGVLSGYLHEHVQVDDLLELAPPYGDFFLHYEADEEAEHKLTSLEYRTLRHSNFNFAKNPSTPIVFISGGIGQTPLLSMLKFLAKSEGKQTARKLFWLHAAHGSTGRAFKKEVDQLRDSDLPALKTVNFLSEVNAALDKEGEDYDFGNRFDIDQVPEVLALETEKLAPHYFFVGPDGFMQVVEKQLKAKQIPDDRIHFEMFGPFHALE